MLSRDHHDVSGTDSPWRETSNIEDGSRFCADMAVQVNKFMLSFRRKSSPLMIPPARHYWLLFHAERDRRCVPWGHLGEPAQWRRHWLGRKHQRWVPALPRRHRRLCSPRQADATLGRVQRRRAACVGRQRKCALVRRFRARMERTVQGSASEQGRYRGHEKSHGKGRSVAAVSDKI